VPAGGREARKAVGRPAGEPSAAIRARVEAARERSSKLDFRWSAGAAVCRDGAAGECGHLSLRRRCVKGGAGGGAGVLPVGCGRGGAGCPLGAAAGGGHLHLQRR